MNPNVDNVNQTCIFYVDDVNTDPESSYGELIMAVNEDLTGFIQEALNRGISRNDIRGALSQADWPADEVETALRGFAEVDLPLAVPRPRPSLSAREAFLYLVLFGTLYVSAYSLGTLLFQLINLGILAGLCPLLVALSRRLFPESDWIALASLLALTG